VTLALFNGHPETGSWMASRGLHYGDGVFRTALVFEGRVVDLDRHIEKLVSDAGQISLSPTGAKACRGEIQALAAGHASAVAKMVLWRRSEQRGYRPSTTDTERLLLIDELRPLPAIAWQSGIEVQRSAVTLAQQPLLAGIKHLGRMEQVLASAQLRRNVTEAIQCDASGRPIGGTRSNLFWVRAGDLYTPRLSACGVAGVMRQKVLEIAQMLRIPWRIGDFEWCDFEAADEAFLTNSLIGIWPVRACDRRKWRAPGAVTRALMQKLSHPLAPA
jgi:4-amino-4-deoxychorismate lyase